MQSPAAGHVETSHAALATPIYVLTQTGGDTMQMGEKQQQTGASREGRKALAGVLLHELLSF